MTEADIYLGVVAARNPGWVRDTFLPYLRSLAETGFDLDPNLLFRTLTGVGAKRVRFREIPDSFWEPKSIAPAWGKTETAWKHLVARFREYGILSSDPMPTQAALVTMITLMEKFGEGSDFKASLYWFLQASRFGRYSGSGTTSLEEDLRDVNDATTRTDAIQRLLRRFPHSEPFTPDDFLRDYADGRFGRFMLYLLAYRNKAQDWDEPGHRIGFEGTSLLADFRPDWDHIFPKKYLNGKVPEPLVDALGNIAVIGPTINIRISAKEPMNYIERYKISAEKLSQQFIEPGITQVSHQGYEAWVRQRAQRLADAGNEFLAELAPPAPATSHS